MKTCRYCKRTEDQVDHMNTVAIWMFGPIDCVCSSAECGGGPRKGSRSATEAARGQGARHGGRAIKHIIKDGKLGDGGIELHHTARALHGLLDGDLNDRMGTAVFQTMLAQTIKRMGELCAEAIGETFTPSGEMGTKP